jgi:thymidylate synthase ThyX
MTGENKTVQKWVDEAMFTATPIDASTGPQVYLLNMTPDPLGAIAAACKGYEGRFVHDLSEITDEERGQYFDQVQKTHLRAPFEFVHFHFLIEGVTRGFTHQMVRQRTATYVQESTRFAVKEDMPVGLPPSLAGTTGVWRQYEEAARDSLEHDDGCDDCERIVAEELAEAMVRESDAERKRWSWDLVQERIEIGYRNLIATGVPAEDARGLLPTNLLTRIQYRTDLKSLIEHGGNRLCTQAQFEWRTVFSKIVEAIRGNAGWYCKPGQLSDGFPTRESASLDWQLNKIASVFRPICYLTGKCEFKADFDRKCSIRERVDKFADHGVPSSEWGPEKCSPERPCAHSKHEINAIHPAEWLLNPGAAR